MTPEQKHTQGPWHVLPHPNKRALEGNLIVCPDDEDLVVCTIWACDEEFETISNARLIAASPDLLEALKIASGWGYGQPPSSYEEDIVQKAIAKATGAP